MHMALFSDATKETVRFFADNRQVAVLGFAAWLLTMMFTLALAAVFGFQPAASMDYSTIKGDLLPGFLMYLACVLVFSGAVGVFYSIATYRFIKTRDLRGSVMAWSKYLPKMIAAQLIKLGAVAVISLVLIAPISLMGMLAASPILSFILFIVAFPVVLVVLVWLGLKLLFVDYLICAQDRPLLDSFLESKRHSDWNEWTVIVNYLGFMFLLALALVPLMLASVMLGGFGQYVYGAVASLLSPLNEILVATIYDYVKGKKAGTGAPNAGLTTIWRHAIGRGERPPPLQPTF